MVKIKKVPPNTLPVHPLYDMGVKLQNERYVASGKEERARDGNLSGSIKRAMRTMR
jgi:hypothetical protein